MAIELDGSGAVSVAEHALGHFFAELEHLCALGVGRERVGSVVERFDFLADREVFVSDGAVRDSGVDHRHREGLVSEESGDRFEAHAAVDGLGREGVSELVRGDVTYARDHSDFVECDVDAPDVDASAFVDEHQVGTQTVGSSGEPLVDHDFELRVERNVSVGVEFADRHAQPVGGSDLNDSVNGEVHEFAFAHPGPRENLDGKPDERVGIGPCGLEQFRRGGVIEESW